MTYVTFRPLRNTVRRAVMDNWFDCGASMGNESDFRPRVDIKETENEINLRFEAPGFQKDKIKVVIEDHVLTVSGTRETRQEEAAVTWHLTEIGSGSFSRSFTLPETIDTGRVNADYKDGILSVTLTKAEDKKPKEIEVKVS